jgi:hypothetical protein
VIQGRKSKGKKIGDNMSANIFEGIVCNCWHHNDSGENE